MQSFALEMVAHGVKVNAICPGNFYDGPLWSDPDRGLFVQYLNSGKVPGAKTVADVKEFYEAKVPMRRGAQASTFCARSSTSLSRNTRPARPCPSRAAR